MKNWDEWLKSTINLAMWIIGFVAVVFKAIDAWEKRKTVQYKELEKRVEKAEDRISSNEDCCRKHDEEVKGIKENAKELLHLIIERFKK
jgi:beta-lactamase regulating signal transducer with metallopeptidase domain